MKHLIYFLASVFLSTSLLATDCIPDCESETDWTLEVRGAYYQPSSKQLRKVYSSSLLDYQVTVAKRVHPFCEIWGELDWTVKRGHGHKHYDYDYYGFRDRTRISIMPLSLGLKVIYPIFPFVDIYAGAGASYSFLRIKNTCREDYYYWGFSHSPFKKEIYKYAFGGLFKVGFQVALSDSTFLDFFADYTLQRFHFSKHEDYSGRSLFRHELDCSGFKLGAGFGVYF